MADVVEVRNLASDGKRAIYGAYQEQLADWRLNADKWAGQFRERDEAWEKVYRELNEKQISTWEKVSMFALQAVELWGLAEQFRTQKKIAKQQRDLIDRQIKILEKSREDYEKKYSPVEDKFIKIVSDYADNSYEPQYDLVAGRMANTVKSQFGKTKEALLKCTSQYCTGATKAQLLNLRIAEAAAVSDAMNSGYMWENLNKQRMDNEFRTRLDDVTRIGLSSKAHTQAGYSNLASTLNADPGAALSQLINGASNMLGTFVGNRVTNRNIGNEPVNNGISPLDRWVPILDPGVPGVPPPSMPSKPPTSITG